MGATDGDVESRPWWRQNGSDPIPVLNPPQPPSYRSHIRLNLSDMDRTFAHGRTMATGGATEEGFIGW